jgi:hypothetical protein
MPQGARQGAGDDLTGVRVHTGHVESSPLDPIPGYEPMWAQEPGLSDPGLVVSLVGCKGFCAGVSLTESGHIYFPVGVGFGPAGLSGTIVYADSMDNFASGWSVQAGGSVRSLKWMPSGGVSFNENLSAQAAGSFGVQSSPGVSITYGLSPSQIQQGWSILTGK